MSFVQFVGMTAGSAVDLIIRNSVVVTFTQLKIRRQQPVRSLNMLLSYIQLSLIQFKKCSSKSQEN